MPHSLLSQDKGTSLACMQGWLVWAAPGLDLDLWTGQRVETMDVLVRQDAHGWRKAKPSIN